MLSFSLCVCVFSVSHACLLETDGSASIGPSWWTSIGPSLTPVFWCRMFLQLLVFHQKLALLLPMIEVMINVFLCLYPNFSGCRRGLHQSLAQCFVWISLQFIRKFLNILFKLSGTLSQSLYCSIWIRCQHLSCQEPLHTRPAIGSAMTRRPNGSGVYLVLKVKELVMTILVPCFALCV